MHMPGDAYGTQSFYPNYSHYQNNHTQGHIKKAPPSHHLQVPPQIPSPAGHGYLADGYFPFSPTPGYAVPTSPIGTYPYGYPSGYYHAPAYTPPHYYEAMNPYEHLPHGTPQPQHHATAPYYPAYPPVPFLVAPAKTTYGPPLTPHLTSPPTFLGATANKALPAPAGSLQPSQMASMPKFNIKKEAVPEKKQPPKTPEKQKIDIRPFYSPGSAKMIGTVPGMYKTHLLNLGNALADPVLNHFLEQERHPPYPFDYRKDLIFKINNTIATLYSQVTSRPYNQAQYPSPTVTLTVLSEDYFKIQIKGKDHATKLKFILLDIKDLIHKLDRLAYPSKGCRSKASPYYTIHQNASLFLSFLAKHGKLIVMVFQKISYPPLTQTLKDLNLSYLDEFFSRYSTHPDHVLAFFDPTQVTPEKASDMMTPHKLKFREDVLASMPMASLSENTSPSAENAHAKTSGEHALLEDIVSQTDDDENPLDTSGFDDDVTETLREMYGNEEETSSSEED